MVRQVLKAGPKTKFGAGEGLSGQRDAYLDRLLKLIPVETVTVYVFVDGIVRSAISVEGNQSVLRILLWIVFAVITAGNLLYLRAAKVTAFMQYLLMTAAFVVWVLTIGGPFSLYAWYESYPFIGPVILALFTFFIAPVYKGVSIR